MSSYTIEIVTPIKDARLDNVSYLCCPGLDGSFGVMNKHREGVFALSIGELKIKKNGKDEYFSIGGGFAEIFNNSVKILVESLEKSNEIDLDRVNKSIERAKKRKIERDPELNEARINASMDRAINRLKISKR
tara:strand:+ start:681 stop:1079 length:399 start_codon:yes stop_codon:yes gene_type:complete